jgi:alkaline phosphatase D
MVLTLSVRDMNDTGPSVRLEAIVPADRVLGNIAVVSNFSIPEEAQASSHYRFSDWRLEGRAFGHAPAHKFGPILWAMYTLNDTRTTEGFVLKMSALTGPMGPDDSKLVELQIRRSGKWISLGTSELDPDAWVATFRVPGWDAASDAPYRLLYRRNCATAGSKHTNMPGRYVPTPPGGRCGWRR